MKFLRLLLVIFLSVSLSPITHANALCDIIDGASALHNRLQAQGAVLGNKMIDLIEKSLKIDGHPRFNNRPDLTPEMAAFEDVTESLGEADRISSGLIGDRTAERFAEVALSDRVVDAQDVTYLTQGSALGRIANAAHTRGLDADELVAQILESRRLNFKNTSRPWGTSYNEAHYLRDIDIVIQNTPATVNPDTSNLKRFLNEQKDQAAGRPFEVRLAAARHKEGILKFANDIEYHGVDLETNKAMYNAGITSQTFAGKLSDDQLDALADAIHRASKLPDGGKRYTFICSELNSNAADIANINAQFDKLNKKLTALDPGLNHYDFSDILVEPFR